MATKNKKQKKEDIIGLKELRLHMDKYIKKVHRGESFTVVRRSRPVFRITPPDEEGQWEVVTDFTQINKNGVDARKILKELRKLNASS
ncbi:MAG: type II toxin-antitoxin system prevent-host-death family antitoxin [Candidatus Spechtbacterales bacterium]